MKLRSLTGARQKLGTRSGADYHPLHRHRETDARCSWGCSCRDLLSPSPRVDTQRDQTEHMDGRPRPPAIDLWPISTGRPALFGALSAISEAVATLVLRSAVSRASAIWLGRGRPRFGAAYARSCTTRRGPGFPSTVRDLVAGSSHVAARGVHSLKGLSEDWPVFAAHPFSSA